MGNRERALNRTERLFALVLLLQNRPNMSSRDLAEHFEVSRRTIFRDLRALGESGVPLTYGEEGGYEILEGYQLPPLMLSGRQAAMLLVGAEFMKLQADASLRKEASEVAMKIRSVLPKHAKEYMDRLTERTVLDPYWLHEEANNASGRWYELSEAIAQRRSIVMSYYVESRKELTRRKVNPLGLVYYVDHWNLVAYDLLRSGIRNFLIENIREMFVLSERFLPPEGFRLQEYLRAKGKRPERTVIRFAAHLYHRARRMLPARIEEERRTDNFVEVTFYFENLAYLARYLLRFGAGIEVVQPPALRRQMHELAAELGAIYD